jgi:hypothetical protein
MTAAAAAPAAPDRKPRRSVLVIRISSVRFETRQHVIDAQKIDKY